MSTQQSFISILPSPSPHHLSQTPSPNHDAQHRQHTIVFSYTENAHEISVIAEPDVVKDFPSEEWLEVSEDLFRALQIDSEFGLESSGKRIHDLSAPLAQAGISIFYLSTYLTDFIFGSQLNDAGVCVDLPITNIELGLGVGGRTLGTGFWGSFEGSLHKTPPPRHIHPPFPQLYLYRRFPNPSPPHLPPLCAIPLPTSLPLHPPPLNPPPPHPSTPSPPHHHPSPRSLPLPPDTWLSFRTDENNHAPPPDLLADARRLDKRLLETEPLRLVGLDREGMEMVKERGWRRAGERWNGCEGDGEVDASVKKSVRFFSYTVTEEGISLVADSSVLQSLPQRHLFTSSELTNLRCVQVDLTHYGLDRYGLCGACRNRL
ncbi:hypothetical protein BC829DRAFT_441877 [Chytridium lagenaria]|nr:hypothetical protein BC829DRAFT_441877 [Chytridium lagenaria]